MTWIGELALDGGGLTGARDEIDTEQTARLLGNDHDGRHVGRLGRVLSDHLQRAVLIMFGESRPDHDLRVNPDGRWDIDEIAAREEPVLEGALDAPLRAEPGTTFRYNNGASHVLSAVVDAVIGRPLPAVASERLFSPLGISRWKWPTDPQGRHWGCSGLSLRRVTCSSWGSSTSPAAAGTVTS